MRQPHCPSGPPSTPSTTRPTEVPRELQPVRPAPDRPADRGALGGHADLSTLDEAKIFAAPDNPADWPAWREQLTRWRADARERIGYTGTHYDEITGDCFSVCLAWLWDEALYDHERGVFTVDEFLDAAGRDFGGFDGVVLWHAYPVIGLDDRNQFDWYRDVPELPEVVRAFQERGARLRRLQPVGHRHPAGVGQ
ncbi:hypothetical protein GCM10027614_02170 [Micromonospora vulcania]